MGFRTPNKAAIERQLSESADAMRLAIEAFVEAVEDVKQDMSDAGHATNQAGAIAFAEELGVPSGTELGQSTEWGKTLIASNTVANAMSATMALQLPAIRTITFKER